MDCINRSTGDQQFGVVSTGDHQFGVASTGDQHDDCGDLGLLAAETALNYVDRYMSDELRGAEVIGEED